MKATHNKAVVRETIIEEKVAATIQTIRTQSNSPKAFLRAAAVIIPLIALSYISITQQDKINNVYTQMASLNPFETTVIVEEVIETTPIKGVESAEIIEIPIAEEVAAPIITQQHTFYIIAGAFAEQKNADKMMKKLKKWNYASEIVEGGNFIRVSYNAFTNKEAAILVLKKIKQENPSAWLLTK
jgi:cell division septation protein DedD